MSALTEAEARVLREIDHFPVGEIRQARYALFARGLCVWFDSQGWDWQLTPAGRAALAAYEKEKEQ